MKKLNYMEQKIYRSAFRRLASSDGKWQSEIAATGSFSILHFPFFISLLFFFLLFINCLYSTNLQNNERLVFDIKYGVINAGEATLNIQKTEYRDQDAWRIFSTANTNSFFDRVFKVRDHIESIATFDDLLSLTFIKRMHEGNYRQQRIHQNYLNQGYSIYSQFRFGRGEWDERRMDIPSYTRDLLSAFYFVRTRDLVPGESIPINITVDGRNNDTIVHVLRHETITTIFGRTECVVIEPAIQGEAIFRQTDAIHIWLTNDDRKIPVLLQSKVIFGHFRAILTKVEEI